MLHKYCHLTFTRMLLKMQHPFHCSLICHQEIFVPPEQLVCFQPRYTVNTIIALFFFVLGKSLVHLQQLLIASSQVLISHNTNFILTFTFMSFFPFFIKFFTHLLNLVLLNIYVVNLTLILYRSRGQETDILQERLESGTGSHQLMRVHCPHLFQTLSSVTPSTSVA